MESAQIFAERVCETKNVRMAVATLKVLQKALKDNAVLDPELFFDLNNLTYRIRTLLAPLNHIQ